MSMAIRVLALFCLATTCLAQPTAVHNRSFVFGGMVSGGDGGHGGVNGDGGPGGTGVSVFTLTGVTITIRKGGVVSGGRSGRGGLSGKGGAGGTGIYVGPPPTRDTEAREIIPPSLHFTHSRVILSDGTLPPAPVTSTNPPPAMDALTSLPLQQPSNPQPIQLGRTWKCIVGAAAVAGAMIATLALFYGCLSAFRKKCSPTDPSTPFTDNAQFAEKGSIR